MHFPSATTREKKSHVTVSAVTLYRTESIIFTMRLRSSRNARRESNQEYRRGSRVKTETTYAALR